jgi:hypothetical protein
MTLLIIGVVDSRNKIKMFGLNSGIASRINIELPGTAAIYRESSGTHLIIAPKLATSACMINSVSALENDAGGVGIRCTQDSCVVDYRGKLVAKKFGAVREIPSSPRCTRPGIYCFRR